MFDDLTVQLSPEQIVAYLKRIALHDEAEQLLKSLTDPTALPPTPNKALLDKMVYSHQLAVPFENLDIFDLGKPIELGTMHLYDKIVTRRRGGYCFELNKMFNHLLIGLGYTTTAHVGRINLASRGILRPRLHRITVVYLENATEKGRYMVDVSFGGPQSASAVLLEPGHFHDSLGGHYNLTYGAVDHTMGIRENTWFLNRVNAAGEDDIGLVSFESDTPQYEVDFVTPNHYTSTHPSSMFVMGRVINRRRTDGHCTMAGDSFKLVSNGQTTEIDVSDPALRAEILKEYFDVVL